MQRPIALGTVLQNRYRLTKILGQGGMVRTYLAEDQGRFNELCALKELIPAQTENYVLESKELFQREAAILYQIQHPQVPQFRATFEQEQRLFLVQDYVEGKTYRTLLDERKAAVTTFSEAEVLHLLWQLLPVLAHLHSRGIIHRNISPDNIIWRESDATPVLIDFGIVNELASRFQSREFVRGEAPSLTRSHYVMHQPKTVGKLGYAPSEQIQTGRAYPSSDLYSLAVTSVVLLTGRDPKELFDDTQLSWNWQRWATLRPELPRVLNRMLSYKPSDRYQSVAEVAQALQALNKQNHGSLTAASIPSPLAPQLPTLNNQHSAPETSQLQTVAAHSLPEPIQSSTSQPNQPEPVIPTPTTRSITDNPWAIAAIGLGVAIFPGLGSWSLVSFLRKTPPPPVPQTFPSPLVSQSNSPILTAADTPKPSTEPNNYTQRLNLPAGEVSSVEGSLKANATMNYTFNGEQGQELSTILTEEGVLLTVLGSNQEPIDDAARRVTRYQGILPFTGKYTIALSPVRGVAESNYKLNIRLEKPIETTPTPTVTPPSTSNLNPVEPTE